MLAVVVATKNRREKLTRMLESIPDEIPVYVYGRNEEDIEFLRGQYEIYTDFGSLTVIQANNYLISLARKKDPNVSVIVACDDIEYEDSAFDEIYYSVKNNDSKLYGLKCLNMVCNDDAFVCISNKIICETAGMPYNEEYIHFYADTELGDKYKSLGRFECINAYFINYHPTIIGAEDKTHTEGRAEKLKHDRNVYDKNKNNNLCYSKV